MSLNHLSQNWGQVQDEASNLAIEYEQARGLLEVYESRQG
jgi:hypothetical protein